MGTCQSNKNQVKTNPPPEQQKPEEHIENNIPVSHPPNANQKNEIHEYKVNLCLDNRSLGVFTFNSDKLLIEIFKSIAQHLPRQAEFYIEIDNNGQDVNITNSKEKRLRDILSEAVEHKVNLKYLGLDIQTRLMKREYFKTTLLGSPRYEDNPFKVVYYNKITKTLNTYIIKNEELSQFNHFSSYCNGIDTLFISGGEKQGDVVDAQASALKTFYAIDLNKGEARRLVDLYVPRFWHSMIYIPNKWVFIVGGAFTKSVELYNINEGTISIDSELNEQRSEATLCCMDNAYLYAFCGFKYQSNYLTTVERCNLQAKRRSWEYVNVSGIENIGISFFTIGYFSEYAEDKESFMILGGNETAGGKCFNDKTYKFEKDQITSFGNFHIADNFPEKFFIPIDENNSILIPLSSDNVKVLVLGKDGNILTMEFHESGKGEFNLA